MKQKVKLTRLERQKREQINSIYAEHSTDKREYNKTFYDICLKNSGKDLNVLFDELNKVLAKQGYYGSVKTLSTRNKKVLSEQSPYFMDDYENMINISKTYKSKILESNYQDESKKEELATKYKKRMVLR